MTIYVDIVSRKIISSPRLKRDVSRIEVKRGDIIPFSIIFVQDGQSTSLPIGSILTFCAKLKNDNEGAAMVLQDNFTLTNVGESYSYDGIINFGGEDLSDYLTNEVATSDDFPYVDLQLEINWMTLEDENYTTNTVILRVYNDVFKGDESLPDITNPVPFVFPYGIKTDTIAPATTGGSVLVSSTLEANHIHGNIAGTLYTHVRTGEAVSKGDPVYVSGFHNGTGQAIVRKADASDAGKMPAIGVMDADYLVNVSGANCVIAGTITSVDTDDFSINSPVYVGDGGGFSETIGTIPQQVGIVERSNQNHGAFVVTNNKVISSADISDFASAVEAIAPDAVTSATTSDGTASLDISNLTLSQAITSGLQTKMTFTAQPTTVGDGQQIVWQWYNGGSPLTTAVIATEVTSSNSDKLIFKTSESGSLATSLDLNNSLATFSGSISSLGESYRSTSTFTYAAGTAAAHRTALGLTTLATTTPAVNVATFLETPTSANLAAAVTGETGTGALVFGTSPTIDAPTISGSAAFTSTTRPTSAGTGTPAATSLITRDDMSSLFQTFRLLRNFTEVKLMAVAFQGGSGSASIQPTGTNWTQQRYATGAVIGSFAGANSLGSSNFSHPCPLAGTGATAINWGVRQRIFWKFSARTFAGCDYRLYWGGSQNTIGTGDSIVRCVGIKITGTSLFLQAHNGTTMTTSPSLLTVTSDIVYDMWIDCDGLGNASLWNSDTLLGTISGLATNNQNFNACFIDRVDNNATTSSAIFSVYNRAILTGSLY
jgi:hypothetical protein